MAHVKKGHLVPSKEWWKHLKWTKRSFWKAHRKAEKKEIVRTIQNEIRHTVRPPYGV